MLKISVWMAAVFIVAKQINFRREFLILNHFDIQIVSQLITRSTRILKIFMMFSQILIHQKKTSNKQKKNLKIIHLCTYDFGGAGKAAYRLHKGLQKIGADSTMLVMTKRSEDPSVKVFPSANSDALIRCLDIATYESPSWHSQCMRWNSLISEYKNRVDGLEIFTDALSDIRLDLIQEIKDADIINLHWVAGLLDCSSAPIAFRSSISKKR